MTSRVIAAALVAAAPLLAQSQSTELHIRFNSGQSVVPVYEGWERVPDGSFNMVFGYLNRNHVEELSLPVGAKNGFEPGPADRGQPTYFYPRENHFLFRVNVPTDWDRKKELVWTIVGNGKTEVARATLLDIWEIDRKVEVSNNGGVQITNEMIAKDAPPVVKIDPIARPRAGVAVTITATVTDDGLPPPNMKPRAPRQVEPSLRGAPPSPVNVPLPARPRPVPGAVSVLWQVYRGPAPVAFDPEGYAKVPGDKGGRVEVKATFSKPGTYTLRAFGHDTLLRAAYDVTVTVDPGSH
ncbi:MAG TPA: hypothetical protein VKH42_20310 [Vicinamibacterales bacterium]|nr:hypothetical protein [Vicinamibacterales bacterium]